MGLLQEKTSNMLMFLEYEYDCGFSQPYNGEMHFPICLTTHLYLASSHLDHCPPLYENDLQQGRNEQKQLLLLPAIVNAKERNKIWGFLWSKQGPKWRKLEEEILNQRIFSCQTLSEDEFYGRVWDDLGGSISGVTCQSGQEEVFLMDKRFVQFLSQGIAEEN